MTVGEKIKMHRKRLGLTQTELGEKLGVKTNAVSKWECGRVEGIPRTKIKAMALLFDVPASYLIDDDTNIVYADFGAKKASSQRDEADEIADVFRKLDEHGKGAVRAILNFEHASAVAENRQAGVKKPKAKVKQRSDGMGDVEVFDQPSAAGLGNYLSDIASHIEQYPANVIPEGTEFGVRISGNSMAPNIPDKATAFVQSKIAIEPGQVGIFLLNGESFCKKLEVNRERQEIRLVSFNPDYKDRIIEECDDFRTLGLVLGHWPK